LGYRLTNAAEADITAIFRRGAAEFGLRQAENYRRGLERTFDFLGANPRVTRERDEGCETSLAIPIIVSERACSFSGVVHVADIVDKAFEAVRKLAPERRDEIADFIWRLAADDSDPEPIDPAHLPAVLEGLEQAKRGQFATPERIHAAFRRFEA
jgi:plasmid stabilization system protein ParE